MESTLVEEKLFYCPRCKENKPRSAFGIHKNRKDGRAPYCRECHRLIRRNWKIEHKDVVADSNRRYVKANRDKINKRRRENSAEFRRLNPNPFEIIFYPQTKKCSKCQIDKNLALFNSCKTGLYGVKGMCKECYLNSLDKNKLRIRKDRFKEKNPDAMKRYSRSYKERNREVFRKRKAKRNRERMAEDPAYKLIVTLRNRARKELLKNITTVVGSKKLLIGNSGFFVKEYLESLFWPGMSWDNYAKDDGWVVDHIIPIASFDKTDPSWPYKAFHYSNLQPLWADDNTTKWDRVDWSFLESNHILPSRLLGEAR